MKCPVCASPLERMIRQGVEIEVCADCRGVWLDRGELDRLIEMSTPPQYSLLGLSLQWTVVPARHSEEEPERALIAID